MFMQNFPDVLETDIKKHLVHYLGEKLIILRAL